MYLIEMKSLGSEFLISVNQYFKLGTSHLYSLPSHLGGWLGLKTFSQLKSAVIISAQWRHSTVGNPLTSSAISGPTPLKGVSWKQMMGTEGVGHQIVSPLISKSICLFTHIIIKKQKKNN